MVASATDFRGIVVPSAGCVGHYIVAANGNVWAQLVASTAADILVIGVGYTSTTNPIGGSPAETSVSVATGGSGSESVFATVPIFAWANTLSDGYDFIPMAAPVRVPSGTRLAIRDESNWLSVGWFWVQYVLQASVI